MLLVFLWRRHKKQNIDRLNLIFRWRHNSEAIISLVLPKKIPRKEKELMNVSSIYKQMSSLRSKLDKNLFKGGPSCVVGGKPLTDEMCKLLTCSL